MSVAGALGQLAVAGDDAGAGQRHALPRPGVLGLIGGEGVDMGGERPGLAGGAQAEVDRVERAFGGRRGQRRHQALGQPRVILRAVQGPRAVRGRGVVVEIVEQDEIEVGGRAHLAAAELAHGDQRHGAALHPAVRPLELAERRIEQRRRRSASARSL